MVWVDPWHFRHGETVDYPFVQINLASDPFGDLVFPEGIIFQVGNTMLVECFDTKEIRGVNYFGTNFLRIIFGKIVVTDLKTTDK